MKRWLNRVPRGWIVLGLVIASWLIVLVVLVGVCTLISRMTRRDSAYAGAMTVEEMTPEAAARSCNY